MTLTHKILAVAGIATVLGGLAYLTKDMWMPKATKQTASNGMEKPLINKA